MPARRLPVAPDLTQLKHQAKDLLKAIHREEPEALADLEQFHVRRVGPAAARLADAQLVLARSYQASSWPRLVLACRMVEAIWRDDLETVRELVTRNPELLHQETLIREDSNWGPPMTYAANVGRDRIIVLLSELGARDHLQAMGRAVLQGRTGTARMLHRMMNRPAPPDGSLGGPAYTLSVDGTELLFELGVRVRDDAGKSLAPIDVVLETDSRKPDAKHRILELYAAHGVDFPDTPTMALHRGRIDLLEQHLRRDPSLRTRTFRYEEIFPPEIGCEIRRPGSYDEGFPRTPLDGTTLLHIAVEFDELEIARWLLDQGMSADVPAATDAEGFGGHTALFGAVVSYPHFWMNYTGGWAHTRKAASAHFAELLLDRGADPNARASLRERVPLPGGQTIIEHRGITPLRWGEVFHDRIVVNAPAMRLVAERGGHP